MPLDHPMRPSKIWGENKTRNSPPPSCMPKATCVVLLSRGAITPPGPEAASPANGSRCNLGGPAVIHRNGSPAGAACERKLELVAPRLEIGPADTTANTMEGNDMIEGRGRPAGITLEPAKGQIQRWQPLLPNPQRVNAAVSASGPRPCAEGLV
jgi:hypothetical protein